MTPNQRQQLHRTLLSAFDLAGLRQLTRFALDKDLDEISVGTLTERVAELIAYAERTGRLQQLVTGAIEQNPDNEHVRELSLVLVKQYYSRDNVLEKKMKL